MRKGLTDSLEAVKDVLDRADVIWLAMVDEDGPYSVPVNFAYLNEKVYIHTGKRGRKAAAFAAGSPVAFSTAVDVRMRKGGDDACNQGYVFRSVMGNGTPRLVEGDEKMAALDVLTIKHLGKQLPYNEKALAVTLVYAIDIETVNARVKE